MISKCNQCSVSLIDDPSRNLSSLSQGDVFKRLLIAKIEVGILYLSANSRLTIPRINICKNVNIVIVAKSILTCSVVSSLCCKNCCFCECIGSYWSLCGNKNEYGILIDPLNHVDVFCRSAVVAK